MMLVDLSALMSAPLPAERGVGRRAGRLVSRGEFRQAAAAWRAAFAAASGQRFALFFEDTLDFAVSLFGAWHAGKTVYLPGDALPATLARLRDCVDGFAGDLPEPCRPLRPVASAEIGSWSPLDPQARQLVIFTSGSTGEPVALEKRLEQLFAEVRALHQAFASHVGAAETLATVSHQHIYGLLFRVLWPLASGRLLHAERLAYLEDVAARLDGLSKAVLVASPAHLKRLPASLSPDARVCAVFSSGGPLPDDALPDCRSRLGLVPIEVYGSSETGGVAWRQRSDAGRLVWRALPGVRWRLQADERLAIESAHLEAAGWARTADRAVADGDGFRLLGRADRIVKIEEKRVSLAAIEQILLATSWLQDLRVLALPGAREQLAVVAVLNEAGWACHDDIGRKALAERLRALLRQSLDAVSTPRRWRFVAALPSNSQGKTTQDALQALFDPRRPSLRLLSLTSMAAELRIIVDATLPQFGGHFPDHPVLPGVAQIEWAILLGRELFPLAPRFLGLEALKFQQVISPGLSVQLHLEFKADSGRLAFKYLSERGQHASGRVLFGAAA